MWGVSGVTLHHINGITDTTVNGNGTDLVIDNITLMCFEGSARIETEQGLIAAENLIEGCLVKTADYGYLPVRKILKTKLTCEQLQAAPHLRPIEISKGALGNGLLLRDLIVSPQHRMLISSKIAQRMTQSSSVLVAAKNLLSLEGVVKIDDCEPVTYVHLCFDGHQIIFAEGAPTESLYFGPQVVQAAKSEGISELIEIFENTLTDNLLSTPSSRPILEGKKAKRLISRHIKNRQNLLDEISI